MGVRSRVGGGSERRVTPDPTGAPGPRGVSASTMETRVDETTLVLHRPNVTGYMSMVSATSTEPPSTRIGQPLAAATASSIEPAVSRP